MNQAEFESIMMQNPAAAAVAAMGFATAETISAFHIGLRDDNTCRVFRDRSGVIFIERATHGDDWYALRPRDRVDVESVRTTRDVLLIPRPADDERRFLALRPLLESARVCDYWLGTGGFVERALEVTPHVSGVDLRSEVLADMRDRTNFRAKLAPRIDELSAPFDLITLFSVLQRQSNPIGLLTRLKERLAPGGHLVVEVPNARDTLIIDVELPTYRDFIFSSEDYVMHTRESLALTLKSVGFVDVEVVGVQRHGLTTHMGWLVDGKPGGQSRYVDKTDPLREQEYETRLASNDRTDTLFAYARRPG